MRKKVAHHIVAHHFLVCCRHLVVTLAGISLYVTGTYWYSLVHLHLARTSLGYRCSLPDLIISCIAAYWSLIHPTCPLIHRPTFDAAYSNSDTGSVYSGKPPAALMYALAASGSRRHHDRVRAHHAGKFYADKATSFLLAGYFSPPPDARSVSDLEAVQTLLILADFYTSQSVPSADLIRTLLPITLQVCMDPSTGIIPLGREPVSPEEWIAGEMRCRAWCAAACLDISFAPSESRPLLYDWTRHPVVIPAHESLFDADPASTGFSLVYGAGARPFAVDFSAPAPGGEENPTAMFIEMVGHRFNRGFAAQVPLPLPTPPTTPGLNAGMGMGGYPAMIPAQRPLVFA